MEPAEKRLRRAVGAPNEESDGLPLPLQLSIPFLPCGWLGTTLARVNRACRQAAIEAHQSRLERPTSPCVTSRVPHVVMYNRSNNEVPLEYRHKNPWSDSSAPTKLNKTQLRPLIQRLYERNGHIEQERFAEVRSFLNRWTVEWRATAVSPSQAYNNNIQHGQDFHLHPPSELRESATSLVNMTHCSLVRNILLVIVVRIFAADGETELDATRDYGSIEDEQHMRKELWAVVYEVREDEKQSDHDNKEKNSSNADENTSTTTTSTPIVLHPVLTQRITDPTGPKWAAESDRFALGDTVRCCCSSSNKNGGGAKFVTVTGLLDMDYYNEQGDVYVSVFEILTAASASSAASAAASNRNATMMTIDSIRRRYVIPLESFALDDYSYPVMSFNSGGEFLSLVIRGQYEKWWYIYDVRGQEQETEQQEAIRVAKVGGGDSQDTHAFFTPDNEFVFWYWGIKVQTERLIEYVTTKFPERVAKKIVLVV